MLNYDEMAVEYARHRRVHPEVLRNLIVTGQVGATSRVLEAGCGTGNYLVALEAAVSCSCWGIEPSEGMLSRAKERSSTINFQLGTAGKLDFPPDFFDLVFSVDVIHHVDNCPDYFQEAYRVLSDDGKVCTVTDSEWIIRHRQPLAVYFPETVDVDLRRYPSIPELRDIMEQAGFDQFAEATVAFEYSLADIQAYRDKAFSCLRLIPDAAFQRGIKRMEQSLLVGPIQCVSRYVMLWGTK